MAGKRHKHSEWTDSCNTSSTQHKSPPPPHSTLTLDLLGEGGSHHVDVFDAGEMKLDVLVVRLVLVAFTRRPVGHSVDLKGSDRSLLEEVEVQC
ncbi:hypothetical protein E2C01_033182 [Portunus trituberculatus]|uniref:Uncharacterized protein n=1 Tax=Portunus trituberculatus TaxID=210409 RepID=A0A5B7F3B7_PORTR|nr:hypothetical protein [Portunus trituberculatus]